MLSNKHKYTILRASRMLIAPFYTFLSLFLNKNDNIVITASHNKDFSDNAKALFEILINKEEFKNRVYFVINDQKKREALNKIYPDRFISNLSFKDALFILRSKYWFCSAMELPLATFFQRHLRQVIHLGHGMLYKKIGLIESKVNWYKKLYYKLVNSSFTYTIATTPFCQRYISVGFGMPLDRVLLTPQPKTFQIAFPKNVENKILNDKSQTHILYAPTWRPYTEVELFPFDDFNIEDLSYFLQENNTHIWLRVHPRFEQNIKSSLLSSSNIHLFSAKEYSEVNSYLDYFDALITDYSSIYYDYLTLKRAVLFFDYDLEEYDEELGIIDEYKRIKSTQTTKSIFEFKEQILDIKNGSFDIKKIKEINEIVNYPILNEDIEKVILERLKLI